MVLRGDGGGDDSDGSGDGDGNDNNGDGSDSGDGGNNDGGHNAVFFPHGNVFAHNRCSDASFAPDDDKCPCLTLHHRALPKAATKSPFSNVYYI
ncbi:hypothetical protein E2542_SST02336 [Spatholobus suberectus]|nr:hypothetical protein E2542_SST02336 [Spatholobus suberectus]